MAEAANMSMPETNKLLFENIQKNNVGEVIRLLNEKGSFDEIVDENGMSMLQHAAYKGNVELCKLLLDRGADVNSKRHVHGYTALMFAALAGKTEVISLFLNAGASISAVNTVGKTAAETAAFVGNHACAVLINNYIPKEDVEYYTRPQGLENTGKLSSALVKPLHNLLVRPDVHPISVVIYLQGNLVLLKKSEQVCRVLNLMCEKEMKRPDPNELLAFKFHIHSFIIKAVKNLLVSFKEKKGSGSEDFDAADIDMVIKCWMKETKSDGFQDVLDKVVRQGIREFPFRQSPVIQKMVHCLANPKMGSEGSAVSVLTTTLNGHQMFSDNPTCATCGSQEACKKCAVCKQLHYCSQQCQKFHWASHKKLCAKLADESKKMMQENITDEKM